MKEYEHNDCVEDPKISVLLKGAHRHKLPTHLYKYGLGFRV